VARSRVSVRAASGNAAAARLTLAHKHHREARHLRAWRARQAGLAGSEQTTTLCNMARTARTRLAGGGLHARHFFGHLAAHGFSDSLAVDDAGARGG
jgi:hypothetical protein